MIATLGVDIGQKHDPTAVCVVEVEPRHIGGRAETHFVVRHLERIPLGTPYPEVARRIDATVSAVQRRCTTPPEVYVGRNNRKLSHPTNRELSHPQRV